MTIFGATWLYLKHKIDDIIFGIILYLQYSFLLKIHVLLYIAFTNEVYVYLKKIMSYVDPVMITPFLYIM